MNQERIAELEAEIRELKIKLQDYINRETELCDREDKMLELQLTAEYERERVMDHKEILRLIFEGQSTTVDSTM
jgi:hypothetical protein